MSRFSFSSSLSLFQSVTVTDSDATSSSTSSNSAINNSSGSLSLSPQSSSNAAPPSSTTPNIVAQLFERQAREPSKFANIKLNNINNHLLELQREIKEEEEEIFADINSLINNRSNLYSSFDEDTNDFEDNLGGINDTTASTTICRPFGASSNNRKGHIQYADYFQEDEDQGLGHDSELPGDEGVTQHQQYANELVCGGNNLSSSGSSSNIQNRHDQYTGDDDYQSCNRVSGQQQQHLKEQSEREQQEHHYLELVDKSDDTSNLQEQHPEEDGQDHKNQLDEYHAIQREDIQLLTSNLPKPCVFFLEGNCRRSDCKYSHDLSSITCKYWIEGFCFKGEMCPFLHSFNQKGQVSSSLDEDISMRKEKLNPTFAIESEADFPSLPLDAPTITLGASSNNEINLDGLNIKNQILSSNPAVVFKTAKKKRKKG